MTTDQPPPQYALPVGMPALATPGQRFAARLIDALVLGLIWTVMLSATGALQYAMDHPGRQDTPRVLLSAALTFTLYFAYEGAMLAKSGQTLGKRALRIRVAVLADGDVPGNRGWVRAAVYALPGILSPLLVGTLFWLVNSLWQLWDKPFGGCLHDKAAGTVVVSAIP
jgi:uncharacterized RDD family membrane protein YckC